MNKVLLKVKAIGQNEYKRYWLVTDDEREIKVIEIPTWFANQEAIAEGFAKAYNSGKYIIPLNPLA